MPSTPRVRANRWFVIAATLIVIALCVVRVHRAFDRLRVGPATHALDRLRHFVGSSGPLATGLNMFRLEVGRLPTTAEGLDALVHKPAGLSVDESQRWHKYIERADILRDPWNRPFSYAYPGQRSKQGYDLWSDGPDGQAGTADDIGNWAVGSAEQE